MADASLRPSAAWSARFLHRLDTGLERFEAAVRKAFGKPGNLREDINAMRLRRLATRGGNGQALT